MGMNQLFLIPPLGYGLILLLTSGEGTLLWLSLTTIAAFWLQARTKRFDLDSPVSFVGDRVWMGAQRLCLFPLLWGSAIRNKVCEAAFWEDPITKLDPIASFSSHIGLSASGELLVQPISSQNPHAILIGPSGSGKTELLRLLATQLECEIWVLDFEGGNGVGDVPRVTLLASDSDSDALQIMNQEFALRNLRALNSKLAIVVDGLNRALQSQVAAILLEKAATQGRKLNVMLLATNQTLADVPKTIWVNCSNRFSLGADQESREQLGFSGRSQDSLGDWGHAELLQGSKLVSFRFPLGFRTEKTAPVVAEAANPLLSRVSSRPQ
jgi:hypothetical protein